MKILAIETSCDETSAAIVENGVTVLSHELASSAKSHIKTGGIVPEVGARQQIISIMPTIQAVMDGYSPDQIDALAVTVGPGLIGSLLVGVETAKTLAWAWEKPLIPVDHVVAHLYSAWLSDPTPELPALGLTISGGHTEFLLIKDHGDIQFLGSTRDDAAGEAFDKIARLLKRPYPGGPQIEQMAKEGNPNAVPLPRPMINEDSLEMSFSGLKTAVRNARESGEYQDFDIAASFQQAVVDVLVAKTARAIQEYQPKSLIIAGGVAANTAIRETLTKEFSHSAAVHVSQMSLAVDNAAIIGSYAYFNNHPQPITEIDADPLYHARLIGTSRSKKL
ncbi:tRNA (adenosine(37)-N6)-threonylcarbamoyltransferase complex transferase subunit TsaD [candidate division WWE3 bacterium]|uniref:tRNA N6-adenosine threonylcarbamoyltransferase n=1 Tax=candidate division WWE3 bacterium TaxID=2053526 RepID=A0A955LH92_UNCKA|nr:tRNA (adenosine(37)-N6)-threonylcarbamoyltransferase complex transferase subunit TsaD [candidate division WWE3 bacterium]